mmetsp:Transcript_68133/g.193041  ORF Transcript_68133/g.193041 Transcript_68133/m.193041 type:complete len:274 (-) Transcript_68133:122-943(-)
MVHNQHILRPRAELGIVPYLVLDDLCAPHGPHPAQHRRRDGEEVVDVVRRAVVDPHQAVIRVMQHLLHGERSEVWHVAHDPLDKVPRHEHHATIHQVAAPLMAPEPEAAGLHVRHALLFQRPVHQRARFHHHVVVHDRIEPRGRALPLAGHERVAHGGLERGHVAVPLGERRDAQLRVRERQGFCYGRGHEDPHLDPGHGERLVDPGFSKQRQLLQGQRRLAYHQVEGRHPAGDRLRRGRAVLALDRGREPGVAGAVPGHRAVRRQLVVDLAG